MNCQYFYKIFTILYMLLSFPVLANTKFSHQLPSSFLELSFAGGVNWINTANNRQLLISAYETDQVRANNTPVSAIWKIGMGYNVDNTLLAEHLYFKHWLIEANLYYTAAEFFGEVWQYQLPQFNNYQFKAPFSSTRFMVDIKPYLVEYNHINIYGLLGLGVAWNSLGYNERVISAEVDPRSALWLQQQIKTNLAYELGFGLRKQVMKQLDLYLEYIYAYLGGTASAHIANSNLVMYISPPNFNMHNQSVLLGFNWRI